MTSDTSESHASRSAAALELLAVVVLVVLAVVLRLPGLEQDMTGIHGWKNIRHYEFAVEMRRTGNPVLANLSWTHPEADPRWEARLTEAPLVTWLLIGTFELWGAAPRTLYMTFLVVAALTHALLYVTLRPLLGRLAAGAGVLMLAVAPLCVYFGCYSIGENLLYTAQLAFLVAVVTLARGYTHNRLALFIAACAYLVLAKLSTGLLLAATGAALVGLWLAWRHAGAVFGVIRRHMVLLLVLTLPVLVAAGAGLVVYGRIMNEWLQVNQMRFLERGFYETLYNRSTDGIGLYLLVAAGAALAAYALLLPLGLVWRWARLAPVEAGALCLIVMAAAATAVQSVGVLAHEYYIVIWVVPLIVLALCLIWRLGARVHVSIGAVALLALLAGFAADQPSNLKKLAYLQRLETLPAGERAALRQFFANKVTTRDRYFVLAHAPAYTFHARTLMVLRWDWRDVVQSLAVSGAPAELLRELGIEYVVFPIHLIPAETRAALRSNPLVDPGPGYWKLGLAHRTERVAIFRICQGVAARQPLPGTGSPPDASAWRALGAGFAGPQAVDGRPVFHSGGRATGALLLGPLAAQGDAVVYQLRGGHARNLRVELGRDGEALYRQYPARSQPPGAELFAMDLTAAGGEDVYLLLVDGHAEGGQLEVSDLDLIAYEPLPWLSGGTEARDEP